MAKIPDVTDLGARNVPQPGRQLNTYRPTVAPNMYETLGQVGKQLFSFGAEKQEEQDRFDYMSRKTEFLKQESELRRNMENNPNTELYQKSIAGLQAKIGAGLTGKYAQQFKIDTDEDAIRGYNSVWNSANTKRKEFARGDYLAKREFMISDIVDIDSKISSEKDMDAKAELINRKYQRVKDLQDFTKTTAGIGALSQEELPQYLQVKNGEDIAIAKAVLAKEGSISTYEKNRTSGGTLDPDFDHLRKVNPVKWQSILEADERAVQIKKSILKNEIKTRVEDNISMLATGESLQSDITNDEFINAFGEDAQKIIEEYQDGKRFAETTYKIKSMTPEQQNQHLELIKPEPGENYAREYKQYSEAVKIVSESREEMAKEPLVFAAQNKIMGITEDVLTPIDFTNSTKSAEIINKRKTAIKMLSDYGVPNKIFTNDEISKMKTFYDTRPPEEVSAMIQNISSGLSVDEKRQVAFAISKEDPRLATVMAVDDPNTAAMVVAGSKTKGSVDKDLFRKTTVEMLSGLVIDPQNYESSIDAIHSFYKKMALDDGDTGSAVDENKLNKAIGKLFGANPEKIKPFGSDFESNIFPYKIGGKYVSGNRVEDVFGSFEDADLFDINKSYPVDMRGNKVSADELKEKGKLFSVGDGKYTYQINIDGFWFPVFDSENRSSRYEIDGGKLDSAVDKKIKSKLRKTKVYWMD